MPIDPADFTTTIDNPYFPLTPGTTLVYRSGDGSEIIRFEVTRETKVVDGVTCVVVLDTAVEDGLLKERTYDYFAQDLDGNVWYFGEDVRNYVDGKFSNTNGSWHAGVDGEPGIIMKANPVVGETYDQERAPGIAEDAATVLALDASQTVPYGSFSSMLETFDFSHLDPALREQKVYAAGIGFISATDLNTGEVEQLVRIERDGTRGADLIEGNVGCDLLRGHAGRDTLDGQEGNDILAGGRGSDTLTGGDGDDRFQFSSHYDSRPASATRDVITDFEQGHDVIDLRAVDANVTIAGNQAFAFIGSQAFHGEEGELRLRATARGLIVEGDVDGDGRADISIMVKEVAELGRSDFIL